MQRSEGLPEHCISVAIIDKLIVFYPSQLSEKHIYVQVLEHYEHTNV